MSQQLYIVRLILPYHSLARERHLTQTTFLPHPEGAFTTRAAAERFALDCVPMVNPFAVLGVYPHPEGFYVYNEPREMENTYFVSNQALNKVVNSMGLKPPKYILSWSSSLFLWLIILLSWMLWAKMRGHKYVIETIILTAILVLTVIYKFVQFVQRKKRTATNRETNLQKWVQWWEENASSMTPDQKCAIWELLANGKLYEVIEVEFEGTTKIK
jgi:hypothetical protein